MTFKCHQFLVLVIFFLHSVSCEITEQPKGYNIGNLWSESVSLSKILKSATETDKKFLNDFSSSLQEFIHPVLLDYLSRENSFKCFKDLKYVFESATSKEWAMKMLDSYAKPESGLLLGNVRWFGEFDECLGVYAPPKEKTDVGDFHGKYCSLEFHLKVKNGTVPLTVGLCLPESCHASGLLSVEVENLKSSGAFPTLLNKIESLLNTTRLICHPSSIELTTSATVLICVIGVFVLLAIAGTSITVYKHFSPSQRMQDPPTLSIHPNNSPDLDEDCNGRDGPIADDNPNHFSASQRRPDSPPLSIIPDNSPLLDEDCKGCPVSENGQNDSIPFPSCMEKFQLFLNCFCILTNGKKLLDTSYTEGQMLCVHGIRFLSITWVIYCHTYGLGFLGTRNIVETVEMVDGWPYEIIKNGFYSVDAFFLLSGFLNATLFFKNYSEKNGKISWLYFYIHRYIRLTPVYMVMIAIYTHLPPYLTSGPARIFFKADHNCLDSWWWNLLYINNFKGQTDQCMTWSWYLASDVQFYVISPLILVSLYRFPTLGWSLICLFFSITCASSFALTYAFDLISGLGDLTTDPAVLPMMSSRWADFFRILYIKPYTRMGPYLVGIALGYMLFRRKQDSRKFRLVTLSTGWAIATGITLACLFGSYHQHFSLLTRSFYNAFHRTCFAGGLAWIIYVCLTGQGDFVNSILSWKAWIPFSRLTYCAYLVHPLLQMLFYTSLKRLLEYSFTTLIFVYLGFLIVSYIVALVVSLLFEFPILKMDKLIRNKFLS